MPFYLVQGLGFAPSQAALLMIPGPIGMAIMGPLSGRFSDKIGTRWLTVTGMALSVAALLTFSMLHEGSPAIHVMIGMALSGCGNGVFSSPNTSSIMSAQPRERYGIISAFLNLTRTSANVTGVAIATTIVTFTMASSGFEPSLSAVNGEGGEAVRMAFMEGLKRAYLIGAGFATTALVITALKGETRPAPTPESGPRESKSAPA
jgi:MFS family permease